MKTIYFIYALLFKKFSIIQIDKDLNGKNVKWVALDVPQDRFGGHCEGNWVESDGKIEAVWQLRKIRKDQKEEK